MASEISLEQTNRIRQALGLVLIPIQDDPSQVSTHPAVNETIERQLESLKSKRDSRKVEITKEGNTLVQEATSGAGFLRRMKELQAKPKPPSQQDQSQAEHNPTKPAHTPVEVPAPAARRVVKPREHKPQIEQDPLDRVEIFKPKYAKTDYTEAPKFKVRKAKSEKRKVLEAVEAPALSAEDFKLEESADLHITPRAPAQVEPRIEVMAAGQISGTTVSLSDSAALLKRLSERKRNDSEKSDNVSHEDTAFTEDPGLDLRQDPEKDPGQAEVSEVPSNSVGLSGMLAALRSNGVLEEPSETRDPNWIRSVAAERAQRARDLAKRKAIDSEAAAKEDFYNRREEIELTERHFKDYKPVVDLKYTDQTGTKVSAKQAWKELSHKFHGTKKHKR